MNARARKNAPATTPLSPASALIASVSDRELPELSEKALAELGKLIAHNDRQSGLRTRIGQERAIKMLADEFEVHIGKKNFAKLILKHFDRAWR